MLDAAAVGADPSGTATTAVGDHEAALNPHDQYLTTAEIVGGANITVDTTTTPGSVILNGSGLLSGGMHQGEWIWEAAQGTPPMQNNNASANDDDVSVASELYVHRLSVNSIDWSFLIETMDNRWEVYAQDLDNADSWHRWGLTGDPTLTGDTWTLPITTISGSPQGTEPSNNARILIGFINPSITDHNVLDNREDPGAHPQYLTESDHAALDHTGLTGVGGGGAGSTYSGATEPDAATYGFWVVP